MPTRDVPIPGLLDGQLNGPHAATNLADALHVPNTPTIVHVQRFAYAAWLALGVYWLALSIGTHLPPTAVAIQGSVSDKALHAGAYFGLGLLAATAWRLTFGRFHRPAALVLLALLAVVGAVDEVTQPYFHRTCDFGDWSSDVVGAAIGLVLFRIVLAVMANRSEERSSAADASL